MITIGIDPHKRSMTAVALDAHSQPLGTVRVAMTDQSVAQLLAWAATWSARRWAVERDRARARRARRWHRRSGGLGAPSAVGR